MCQFPFGGSSATTDRKQVVGDYGRANAAGTSLSNAGATSTAAGTADTGAASKYYQSILSSNPAAVKAATAPQIADITGGAETQKRELSQPGDRAGGTNAAKQGVQTAERGQIADVTAKARGGAADSAGKLGVAETGLGIGATADAGNLAVSTGSLANNSRALSARLHADAVRNWANLIGGIFSGEGAIGALSGTVGGS